MKCTLISLLLYLTYELLLLPPENLERKIYTAVGTGHSARFGYDQGSAFQCNFSKLRKLEVSKNIIINFSMNKEFDKKIVIEVSNNILIIY